MNYPFIRLLSVRLHNIKNIQDGCIELNKNKEKDFDYTHSDVLGIYGQNGSGKTAVIQVLALFKALAMENSLWPDIKNYIKINESECSFDVKFAVQTSEFNKYIVSYFCTISAEKSSFTDERLSVSKLDTDGTWTKTIPYYECKYGDDIQVFEPQYRYENVAEGNQERIIKLSVALKMSQESKTSLLFSNNFISILSNSKETELKEIVTILKTYAKENIFTILNPHNGVISIDAYLPLIIFHDKKGIKTYGEIPITLQKPMETSEKTFNLISSILTNMNGVIKAIVPGLSFDIKNYGQQLLQDGSTGVRYEIVSNRYGASFPLRYESEGIKRIFSVLSVLIGMYNNPSMLVAIDELDAGVFESLLGTLIHVIEETGKGQLIFTSHNLRPLEVLNKDNVIFSTTNESNRYIRMTNIKDTNNLRDCYIRALSLGGQKEDLGTDIRESEIRRALRNAGKN